MHGNVLSWLSKGCLGRMDIDIAYSSCSIIISRLDGGLSQILIEKRLVLIQLLILRILFVSMITRIEVSRLLLCQCSHGGQLMDFLVRHAWRCVLHD